MFCKVVWRVVSTISAKVQDAELVVFKAVGVEGRCGFCGKENQNSCVEARRRHVALVLGSAMRRLCRLYVFLDCE